MTDLVLYEVRGAVAFLRSIGRKSSMRSAMLWSTGSCSFSMPSKTTPAWVPSSLQVPGPERSLLVLTLPNSRKAFARVPTWRLRRSFAEVRP